MERDVYDVVVVGSGNAGFSAASSAIDSGASKVLLLEKAPEAWAGGNTTFTAGAYRTVFSGLDDVLPIVHNVPPELVSRIDMNAYTQEDFLNDLRKVTSDKTDPEMAKTLVCESNATTKWLAQNGVKFQLSFNRQAYEIDGRFKFWGGMVLSVVDGGKGLTQQHQANARRKGVEVRYNSHVASVSADSRGHVCIVKVRHEDGNIYNVHARGGVILAAGGFESSSQMRAKHLGPKWSQAYVRGTPHNDGEMLQYAIDHLGASTAGHWMGCHSTCWDANANADVGDPVLTNQYTKSGYPLGLMFNCNGDRFVDEGLDMRNYTYAKFGRAILEQPNGIAFQVWDANAAEWLRKEEYAEDVVERITADTLEDLSARLQHKGLADPKRFISNMDDYNEAVEAYRQENPNLVFDPSKKDGLSTRSRFKRLDLDKTNWAVPIVKPPFVAVKVTCGITFTFGGLKIDPSTAAVIDVSGQPISGLYAAGEMAGGLFYDNYPGGSGLTAGAVFGRKAGYHAAMVAKSALKAI